MFMTWIMFSCSYHCWGMSQWANIRNVNSLVIKHYVESKTRQPLIRILKPEYPFKLIDQDIGTLSWCKGLSNYIICNSILHWSQITIICKKSVGIRLSEDHEASSAWLSGGYDWRVNCTLFSIWNNLAQHIRYLVWPNRSSTNATDYVTKYKTANR